jgi:hypothetical protein
MEEIKHKYVHRETIRERISYGRSDSRCETFKQTDIYFCEKCLEEKTAVKEWCGQLHYRDCPEWVKTGTFTPKTIW